MKGCARFKALAAWMVVLAVGAPACHAQDSWTSQQPLSVARAAHASAWSGGILYVFGGYRGASSPTPAQPYSIEAYDPVTDAWTALPAMSDYQGENVVSSKINWVYSSGAAVGGDLYQFGGDVRYGTYGIYDNTCWKYNIASQTWTQIESYPGYVDSIRAMSIGSKIYVTGRGGLNTLQLFSYDTGTATWKVCADYPALVWNYYAAPLAGRPCLAGGINPDTDEFSRACYSYDPVGDVWNQNQDLPTGFQGGVSGSAKNRMFVMGGYDDSWTLRADVLELDPSGQVWSTRTSMPQLKQDSAATPGLDNAGSPVIYVTGGIVAGRRVTSVDRYTPMAISTSVGILPSNVDLTIDEGAAVHFAWTSIFDNGSVPTRFAVEVSQDPAFVTGVTRAVVTGSLGTDIFLAASKRALTYYWRVQSIDAAGNETGPWSARLTFRVVLDDKIDHGAGDAKRFCGVSASGSLSPAFAGFLALAILGLAFRRNR